MFQTSPRHRGTINSLFNIENRKHLHGFSTTYASSNRMKPSRILLAGLPIRELNSCTHFQKPTSTFSFQTFSVSQTANIARLTPTPFHLGDHGHILTGFPGAVANPHSFGGCTGVGGIGALHKSASHHQQANTSSQRHHHQREGYSLPMQSLAHISIWRHNHDILRIIRIGHHSPILRQLVNPLHQHVPWDFDVDLDVRDGISDFVPGLVPPR